MLNKYHYFKKAVFSVIYTAIYFIGIHLNAQPVLTGMTSTGGDEFGVIYTTDENGDNLQVVHSFKGISGAYPYYTHLCEAGSGKLYGLLSQGGKNNMGVIFEYDTFSQTYQKLFEFDGAINGHNPRGSLIMAGNGKLYGMTNQGGLNNYGVIFEFDPGTLQFTKLYDFDGTNGRNPFGDLLQASNGLLYGMTYQGGASNDGVMFEFNLGTGVYTKLMDFDGSNNGRNPFGSLMQASNGLLYAVTYQGGTNNLGVLFSYDVLGSSYTKLHDFDGSNTGSNPYSTFVEAGNGMLYSMTYLGGSNNLGALIEYDFVNSVIDKKVDFNGTVNGRNPFGNLIADANGKLHGLVPFGGANNAGVIIEYDPGTNVFTKKADVNGGNLGRSPFGSLMLTSNQKMFGLTYQGGVNNSGILFEYNYVNGTYDKKIDFNSAIDGSNPYGDLTLASNLKLYGMTYQGGSSNAGVIFELDPKTKLYTKKFDFDGLNFGKNTYGTLVEAKQGKLYGMTFQGGVYDFGTLFEYDFLNDTCIKLFDFDGTNSGRNPYSSLLLAKDSNLYGMTTYGGQEDYGVLFKYDLTTKSFSKLIDFGLNNGNNPFGEPIQADNGLIYGLTYSGGVNDMGTLFEYDPVNLNFVLKQEFDGINTGSYPLGSLHISNDKFYGLTQYGGLNNVGALFSWELSSNSLIKLLDFSDTIGKNPTGNVIVTNDGMVYGKTQSGGSVDEGVLFEYDLNKDTLVLKIDFDGNNGSRPYGSIIRYCLPSFDTLNLSVCDSFISPSGKYVWKQTGKYSDTIPAISSCDSVLSISLNILKSTFSTLTVSNCDSLIAPDGKIYKTSGSYLAIIANTIGCDSVITIHYRNLKSDTTFTVYTCGTYKAPDGSEYAQSGTIVAKIPNFFACDSIMTIHVLIMDSDTNIVVNACRSYTAPDGLKYTNSGNIKAVVPNFMGCDSTINIQLNVVQVDVTVIQNDSQLLANSVNSVYRWLYCDSAYKAILGANAKEFIAVRNGSYAVEIASNGCKDTSDCYAVSTLNIIENSFISGINVYPNPSSGKFRIDLNKDYRDVRVVVTDINGREVSDEFMNEGSEFEINLDNAPGVYLIKISTGQYLAVLRLIKN